MPQASERLRSMFEDDQAAFAVIDGKFDVAVGFIIRPVIKGYTPNEKEGDAIDYLCDEWDFGYSPKTMGEV